MQAGRLLLDLIRFASDLPEEGDNPDEVQDPSTMTPAQGSSTRHAGATSPTLRTPGT